MRWLAYVRAGIQFCLFRLSLCVFALFFAAMDTRPGIGFRGASSSSSDVRLVRWSGFHYYFWLVHSRYWLKLYFARCSRRCSLVLGATSNIELEFSSLTGSLIIHNAKSRLSFGRPPTSYGNRFSPGRLIGDPGDDATVRLHTPGWVEVSLL